MKVAAPSPVHVLRRVASVRRLPTVALLTSLALCAASINVPADAGTADQGRGGLVVIDAGSGKERWRAAPSAGRFFSRPGVGRKLIVAGDTECVREKEPSKVRLVAFDPETGDQIWNLKDPVGSVSTKTMYWLPTATVDVGAQGVVVTGGGRLSPGGQRGLDAKTGKTVWRLPDIQELGVSSTLVFGQAPSTTLVATNVLAAHDRRTGELKWVFPTSSDAAWVGTFDVVAGDENVVVVGSGGYLGRMDGRPFAPTTFFVLDARTGQERVRFQADDPGFRFSDFLMTDGLLVYEESGKSILARQLVDGAVRWQTSFDAGSDASENVLRISEDPDTVFAVDFKGTGVVLDTRTGARKWTLPGDLYLRASGSHVSVLDERSRIRGVSTAAGKSRWKYSLGRPLVNSLTDGVDASVRNGSVVLSSVCDTG